MNAEWVLAISTVGLAVATLLVFIVAVFQDRIRLWFTHPELEVSIRTAPPDCHKVPMFGFTRGGASISNGTVKQVFVANAYYLRLRIKNRGNDKAEFVEVLLDTLSRQQADGAFGPVESFLPLNLYWSNIREAYMPVIYPDTFKLCDLGHIIDPPNREVAGEGEHRNWEGFSDDQTILSLETSIRSTTMSHLIPPGIYKMRIIIAAANAKPIRKTLEINLAGKWYEDEREMLEQGIGITMLN